MSKVSTNRVVTYWQGSHLQHGAEIPSDNNIFQCESAKKELLLMRMPTSSGTLFLKIRNPISLIMRWHRRWKPLQTGEYRTWQVVEWLHEKLFLPALRELLTIWMTLSRVDHVVATQCRSIRIDVWFRETWWHLMYTNASSRSPKSSNQQHNMQYCRIASP